MGGSEPITLSRACEVVEIPSGIRSTLPAGAVVRIMQSLGLSLIHISAPGCPNRNWSRTGLRALPLNWCS